MTQQKAVSDWILTPTIRDPIRLPPVGRDAARIVAVIRALLLEDRITARDDYRTLVDLMRSEIQGIKSDAGTLKMEDTSPAEAERLFDARYADGVFGSFQEGERLAKGFAKSWLFKSEAGELVLWALVAIDAFGANPLALDWQRAHQSETWQTAYNEPQPTHPSQKHKDLMAQLKLDGWKILKDPNLLANAKAWVEVHHIHHGRLSEWLEVREKESLQYDDVSKKPNKDDVSKWSTRLKPFDDVLGRERVRWGKERQKAR